MPVIAGLIAGLAVFGFWMSIVGNPHVVETVLGLVILGAVWFAVSWYARKFMRNLARPKQ